MDECAEDSEAPVTFREFRTLAWEAANEKARDLGWVTSSDELHEAVKRAGGAAMQEYNKLVVRYDPAICIHAGECVRGLPSVFNLSRKPWIDVNGASAAAVIEQVTHCPSGALTYQLLDEAQ